MHGMDILAIIHVQLVPSYQAMLQTVRIVPYFAFNV
jgi:hypothetical protein